MTKTTTTLGAITPGEAIVELHHEGPYYGNITVVKEPGVIHFNKHERPMFSPIAATLIIGGEPVFTEAQVRAIIADLKDQTMSMAVEQSIDRIAKKHGITL